METTAVSHETHIRDQTLKTVELHEIIEVLPQELFLNHRELAYQRLHEHLSKQKSIVKVHNISLDGAPEVMRGTGSLHYSFTCTVTVFKPVVGEITHAKVVGVLKIGIKLMIANMMCVLSEIVMKEKGIVVQENSFIYDGQRYSIGDVVPVKIMSLQKRIMENQELLLAYVTMVESG